MTVVLECLVMEYDLLFEYPDPNTVQLSLGMMTCFSLVYISKCVQPQAQLIT